MSYQAQVNFQVAVAQLDTRRGFVGAPSHQIIEPTKMIPFNPKRLETSGASLLCGQIALSKALLRGSARQCLNKWDKDAPHLY